MGLPKIITPALLNSVRTHQHLPRNTWYFITGATLSALNRPDQIPEVFEHAIEKGSGAADASPSLEEQLQIARRMREALVKTGAVIGLPKTINSLLALKKTTPSSLMDEPLGVSPTLRAFEIYDVPSSKILQRGQNFFDQVYGKVSKRVMGQMDRSGTEDLGLTARLMYSYILSNTQVLNAAESSFVLVAALIPQDVNPQLKGHLKGAINNGATLEQVRAVRDVVIQICEASGMKQLNEQSLDSWGWRNVPAKL